MSGVSYIRRPNRPLMIYALLFLVFLYIPVLFLPLFSLNDSQFIAFPLKGFTLRWYQAMLADEALQNSLLNSIKVGLSVSAIATLLGIFAAKAVTRYRVPGAKTLVGIIMLPMVVPGIILGTAILMLTKRLVGLDLSLFTVGIGHILLCVPFSMATLISRFEGFDKAMEEASADLGENAWWTFWRVTFPMVFPGILSSFLLCFTVSFDEFIMAFLLGSTEQTLPVFMWNQLRFPQRLPSVLALGTLILVVSFFVITIAELLRRGPTSGRVSAGNPP